MQLCLYNIKRKVLFLCQFTTVIGSLIALFLMQSHCRTDIERTPATNRIKDRIYIPKVKRNIIYDLREITGGFAYLQNIIEGELIREYTGREHVPGIYLQQTPFPCHIYDS